MTTLPKDMWPLLLCNIDSGGESADSVYENHKVMTLNPREDGLPSAPPSHEDPWNMILVSPPAGCDLVSWLEGVITWPHWSDLGIRSFVFDGWSTLGKSLLIATAASQQFVSDSKKGDAAIGIGEGESKLYQPQPGDYGLVQNALSSFRQLMVARPWHVLTVAHEIFRVDNTDMGTKTFGGPNLPGRAISADFAAEWSQYIRLRSPLGNNEPGAIEAQLMPTARFGARVRRTPGALEELGKAWPLEYNHTEFWSALMKGIGMEPTFGPALECYKDHKVNLEA